MKLPETIKIYGDINFRKKCPSETAEQITFFNIIRKQHPDSYGIIAVHPRNEGVRTAQQTVRQKAEGMTPGAADIVIPGNPSFVCEIKRRDHTKSQWQPEQLRYLEAAQDAGSFVCIALGYEAALEAFNDWKRSQCLSANG